METFQNRNGKNYEILEEKNDYYLLKEIKKSFHPLYDDPYVVAYHINNDGEWAQGHYFKSYDNAKQLYDDKVNRA